LTKTHRSPHPTKTLKQPPTAKINKIEKINYATTSLITIRFNYLKDNYRKGVLKVYLEEYIPLCERCGQPVDNCECICPYCGETCCCDCCIGMDKATGG
ncbi:MAG: hypothetical protein ACPLY9_03920, partial [Nitrososphaerales archaeon]